ncbi:MAG: DUF4339 domain-containing protein [Pirellulales bacterium]|nr:DUF4339 domain-containing protein [Pirellulales bacterium]
MGIRFFCPNGHKLNVKTFQAGKRGICPHCGAKFTIPLTSTRPSSRSRSTTPGKEFDEPDEQDLVEPIEPAAQPDPAPTPSPAPAPPTPPPISGECPLAEAPNAQWYVSPSGGGQFGPASADVMRTWIDEGRVAADSLVWREGWEDWRPAEDVFEEIGGPVGGFSIQGAAAPAMAATEAGLEDNPIAGTVGPSTTTKPGIRTVDHPNRMRKRRHKPINPILMIGLMLGLIVILAVVLIMVLTR